MIWFASYCQFFSSFLTSFFFTVLLFSWTWYLTDYWPVCMHRNSILETHREFLIFKFNMIVCGLYNTVCEVEVPTWTRSKTEISVDNLRLNPVQVLTLLEPVLHNPPYTECKIINNWRWSSYWNFWSTFVQIKYSCYVDDRHSGHLFHSHEVAYLLEWKNFASANFHVDF